MIKNRLPLIGLALALFAGPASAQVLNSTAFVHVQDNASPSHPIAGAIVWAVTFSTNSGSPNPILSTNAVTDSNGNVTFSPGNSDGLAGSQPYQILAVAEGYTPGLLAQFQGGAAQIFTNSAIPNSSTVTLTAATGLGEIDLSFTNATAASPNIVMGQIVVAGGGSGAVQYALATVDPTGAGLLRFMNVPTTTSGGVYGAAAFDPLANSGRGQGVPPQGEGSPLTNGGLLSLSVDFAAAGQPPVANIQQSQQNANGQNGNLSVTGLVTSTDTLSPLSNVNVMIGGQYVDGNNNGQADFRGTNTDQNGLFQFYGLIPGVTYYLSVTGTCNGSSCYAGFQANNQGVQATQIVQNNVTVINVNGVQVSTPSALVMNLTAPPNDIQLQRTAPSTGTVAIYVQDQFGDPIPQAGFGLFPDGSPWQETGTENNCTGPYISAPGLVSLNGQATTGYALVKDLPSGNYQLNAWTPYGQTLFNNGSDGQSRFGNGSGSPCNISGSGNSTDDLRLTIDTTQPNGQDVMVFDEYGALVQQSSYVVVTVQILTGSSGLVSGTITLPNSGINLSNSPILLTLQAQCNNGGQCPPGGGFKVFNGASVGPTISYSIPVSSGQAYNLNVQSQNWGAVYPNGNQPVVDLTATSSATLNLTFAAAGGVVGTLRKPDGTAYVPANVNQAPNVVAQGNGAWGNTQINPDGSFVLGGLLPGTYQLQAFSFSGGNFPYTAILPNPTVTVVANQDVNQDLQLVQAVNVQPVIDTTMLPALSIANCAGVHNGSGGGNCPPEDWQVLPLPAGSQLNSDVVNGVIVNGGGDANVIDFEFAPSSGQQNNIQGCNGTVLPSSGFCPQSMPANGQIGTAYDFYLMRTGGFDSGNQANGAKPYFVIELSSRAVPVNTGLATTPFFNGSSNSSIQTVVLKSTFSMAAVPEAVLVGSVTAANMITPREFQALGGDFKKFTSYLPITWVYDSAGVLKAAGVAVPYPPAFGANNGQLDNEMQALVSSDNYTGFINLLTQAPPTGVGALGYEIRGLTAGQTYNIVTTSPNYPPSKATIKLSNTPGFPNRQDFNLDTNPGATLTGVVESTSSARLVGAQVTISAPGYSAVTLTTDNSGTYSLLGLAAGQYTVDAVAAGYVETEEFISVSGNGTITATPVQMTAATAGITGLVSTTDPDISQGAVFAIKLDTSSAYPMPNVSVYAYDETQLIADPSAPLALAKTVTSSSGTYTLTGLKSGDVYRVYVNQAEYYVADTTTQTIAGLQTGVNFNLVRKPLSINVFGYQSGSNYEFQITNQQDFSGGNAWIGASPFVLATSTPVTSDFQQRPDAQGNKELYLDYPISSLNPNSTYDLHIVAQPSDPTQPQVVDDLTFGINYPNNSAQAIDQALIGDVTLNAQGVPGNEVTVDPTGNDPSAVTLPPGGVIPTFSTAVPSISITAASPSAVPQASVGVTSSAFAGNVYTVTLSSINYAGGVDMTLKYNQSGSSLNDLAVYTFDSATNQWISVPGTQTLDPVSGTISLKKLKSLASVLSVQRALMTATSKSATANPPSPYMALTDGRSYRVNPASLVLRPDDLGLFAVMRPSQVSGGNFSGTTVKVYNFPNPFNLTTKTIQPNTDTATNACGNVSSLPPVTTDGTIIKYEVPANLSGQGAIRIYTISGRLVREIDAGDVVGGNCYYTTWDGRNRTGQQVANGVYYGILTIAGNKAGGSNGIFKMAVIK